MSDAEKDFYDTYADSLKKHFRSDGYPAFTKLLAWSYKNSTWFYCEVKGPDSTWIWAEDGKIKACANSAKVLKISEKAAPVLDDYSNVMEVVNLYLDL